METTSACLHQNSNRQVAGCLTDTIYSVPWFMYIKLEDRVVIDMVARLTFVHSYNTQLQDTAYSL